MLNLNPDRLMGTLLVLSATMWIGVRFGTPILTNAGARFSAPLMTDTKYGSSIRGSNISILNRPSDSMPNQTNIQKLAKPNVNTIIENSSKILTSLASLPNRRLLENEKPIIYTFYSPINVDSGTKGTGMSDQADKDLLIAWRRAWEESGWDPIILNIKHAQKHPDFEVLNQMLDGLPFGYYDRLCFLRWLAMATVGGGWMVDYDTFPLFPFGPQLANSGRFTVHEGSEHGGVPSLASGSGDEWYRIATSLIENAVQHKDAHHWSDMIAMQDVYQKSNNAFYALEWNVVPGLIVLTGQVADRETCKRVRGRYAVHFSHFSIDQGVTKDGAGPEDRAIIATEWLAEFRKSCLSQTEEKQLPPPTQEYEPKIYTFFSPDPNDSHMAGMSPEANSMLLTEWTKAWKSNGFIPIVLNIENAKSHPEFADLDRMLDGLPFGYYDRLCFLRWLAMVTVDGGWMVDYDTFPLHIFDFTIPNDGKLTVHEYSRNGGVPSMVSGNKEEWYRLAKAHVENARDHRTQSHWSDMKALHDLFAKSGGSFYQMGNAVVPAFNILRKGQEVTPEVCDITRNKLAAHFSHYSIHVGNTSKKSAGAVDRAEIATSWLVEWRQKCNWGNEKANI